MEELKNILLPFLSQNGLSLYDIKVIKEYGQTILQVLIDSKDKVTFEELENVNNFLSDKLDSINIFDNEYMLEVSSAGCEKELRTKEEIKNSINEYIYVEYEDKQISGYLRNIDNDDILTIEVNLKGRIRKVQIEQAKIRLIRLAVKF